MRHPKAPSFSFSHQENVWVFGPITNFEISKFRHAFHFIIAGERRVFHQSNRDTKKTHTYARTHTYFEDVLRVGLGLRRKHRVVGLDHHRQIRAVDQRDVVVVLAEIAQREFPLAGGAAGADVRRADVIRVFVVAEPRRAPVDLVAARTGPDSAAPARVACGFGQVVAEIIAGFEHAVRVAPFFGGQVPVATSAQLTAVIDARGPKSGARIGGVVFRVIEGNPVCGVLLWWLT